MNHPTFERDSADKRSLPGASRRSPHVFLRIRVIAAAGRQFDKLAFSAAEDVRTFRLAQSGGRLDQRVEHRLEIEGRAADDLEHVGGGGLLLQSDSRSSFSRRVFSMAMTACSAKF